VLFRFFFFSSRRRHTRFSRDWSSDVCSSDLHAVAVESPAVEEVGRLAPAGQGVHAVAETAGDQVAGAFFPVVLAGLGQRGEGERSEERRVGKEGRCRWGGSQEERKEGAHGTA